MIPAAAAGFGYAASPVALQAAVAMLHPTRDGLWIVDTNTGSGKLLLSLKALYTATIEGVSSTTRPSLHAVQNTYLPRLNQICTMRSNSFQS